MFNAVRKVDDSPVSASIPRRWIWMGALALAAAVMLA